MSDHDFVTPAVEGAKDTRGHRQMWIALAVTVLGLVGFGVIFWLHSADQDAEIAGLRQQNREFASSASKLGDDSRQLAAQVRQLGGTPVVQPPAVGPAGPAGPQGTAGRGITGTQLIGGHLIVVYTDGSSSDVGQVAGQPGTPGSQGRSITSTTLAGGHLMLTYSDGAAVDLGSVVGPAGVAGPAGQPGRGVLSVSVNSASHLVVAYTDGTTSDAGTLPAGPAGPSGPAGPAGAPGSPGQQGPQGSPPYSWTWSDAAGKHTCTRSGGTDAQPTYACTTQFPAATTPTGR